MFLQNTVELLQIAFLFMKGNFSYIHLFFFINNPFRILAPKIVSHVLGQGSWSWILNSRFQIVGPVSWVLGPKSWVIAPESWVPINSVITANSDNYYKVRRCTTSFFSHSHPLDKILWKKPLFWYILEVLSKFNWQWLISWKHRQKVWEKACSDHFLTRSNQIFFKKTLVVRFLNNIFPSTVTS